MKKTICIALIGILFSTSAFSQLEYYSNCKVYESDIPDSAYFEETISVKWLSSEHTMNNIDSINFSMGSAKVISEFSLHEKKINGKQMFKADATFDNLYTFCFYVTESKTQFMFVIADKNHIVYCIFIDTKNVVKK